MNVVEHNNYWDGIMNGGEEFVNILDMLDFPMESLEGDGLGGEEEDLDPSKFQNLGPIPMDALVGLPPVSQGNIGKGSVDVVPCYGAPINIKSGRKELPNCVKDTTGIITSCQNLISTESSAFQTASPISVLESCGSCSSGKSSSIIAGHPVRARSKRARKSTVNPWLLISPIIYTAATKKSSNTRENKEKKRRLSQLTNALEDKDNFSLPANRKPPEQLDSTFHRSVAPKRCTHCEVTKTPQWRVGPLGPKTLCNACGVRYRSGRLFPEYRPAASPTFVPSLHSNSHRKVIAMRKQAMLQQASVADEGPPMSPLPELISTSNYHLLDYIC